MGMEISEKLGNGGGREWELNRWEWQGMGMLKAIPAHLYSEVGSRGHRRSKLCLEAWRRHRSRSVESRR